MIKNAFANGKALIPFVTAGDPDLATTEVLLAEMDKNGADIILIGIPFSDPIAEGVAIQEADLRALAAGVTTDKIFDMLERVHTSLGCELAFMTYMNPIFVYGVEKFMQKCAACGVSAVVVPDTPFEEKAELQPACDKYGVSLISMIAPTSNERIQMIAKEAQGFVFCIPSLGAAGVKTEPTIDIGEMVGMVKVVRDIPVAIGFGAPDKEEAAAAAAKSDGVIIGSHVVEIIAQHGKNCVAPVAAYVKEMKQTLNES